MRIVGQPVMMSLSDDPARIRSLRWLAWPYEWTARFRAMLYRRRWLRAKILDRPVISVGNLTVGGTGKTPVVIFLAEWLLEKGKRIAILSRGYGRRSSSPQVLVSDGERLLVTPEEAGDEPYLIACRCPQAIVAVGADRFRLGRWVLERFPVDYFVLDDGFQHLSLHRTIDLLLLDATDVAGIQAMLPVGRLREPLSAAARASAILFTRVEENAPVKQIWQSLTQACGSLPDPMTVAFKAEGWTCITTGERRSPVGLQGQKAIVFSGIGNARSFHHLVERLGVTVLDTVVMKDHTRYDAVVVETIRERARRCGAEVFLTTEKDAGKIAAFLNSDDPCWAVRLQTDVLAGRERLERLLSSPAVPSAMEACA
jgi:tetraacyldisaccharide 4'-kinase